MRDQSNDDDHDDDDKDGADKHVVVCTSQSVLWPLKFDNLI